MSLINDVVLKQAITDTVTSLASHIVEYEPYTDDEIAELFNLTPEEVQRVTDIISDTVISQYKLWSSKKVNDEISAAKEECNTYAEELAAKIATMSTTYTDSLPVTGSSNIIYVLKETSEEGIVSHTINLWNSDINDYVKCGSIEQALNNIYTKEQIDAKLKDYALKTEIISQDDLVTTISDVSTASHDKVPTELAIANALSSAVKISSEVDNMIEEKTDGLYVAPDEQEISWSDYQALSEEEKNNGTTYYIPDMPANGSTELTSETEYGSFFSKDMTSDELSVGCVINFEQKTRGNLVYDNGIKLTKGKLYHIYCNVAYDRNEVDNSHIRYGICINGQQIWTTNGISIASGSTSKWSDNALVTHYYCENDNEVLTVNCVSISNINTILGGISNLIVTEIPSYKGLIDISDDHIRELSQEEISKSLILQSDKTAFMCSEDFAIMQVVGSNGKFRVQLQNGFLNKWKYNEDTGLWDKTNICDTKVDDIPKTDVVFTDSNVSKTGEYEICQYYIKNGYCHVSLHGLTFSSSYTNANPFATLPKPVFRCSYTLSNPFGTTILGKLFLEPNGEIHLYTNIYPVPDVGFITFSYPVAES